MTRWEAIALVCAGVAIILGLWRIAVGVEHGDGLMTCVWLFGAGAAVCLWWDFITDGDAS
jgi:hypothetical protein